MDDTDAVPSNYAVDEEDAKVDDNDALPIDYPADEEDTDSPADSPEEGVPTNFGIRVLGPSLNYKCALIFLIGPLEVPILGS